MSKLKEFNEALHNVLKEHVIDYKYFVDIFCDVIHENRNIDESIILSKLNVENMRKARGKYSDEYIYNTAIETYDYLKDIVEDDIEMMINQFAYQGCCYIVALLYKLEYGDEVEILSNGIDKHCIVFHKQENVYCDYQIYDKSFDISEYHLITKEEEKRFLDSGISEFYNMYANDVITDELRTKIKDDLSKMHMKIDSIIKKQ